MVEEIEELAAQFELQVFAIDVPILAKRQIVIYQPAVPQFRRVAYDVAPGSICRHCKRSDIEPLRRGPVSDLRTADLIRKLRLTSKDGADILVVARDIDGERQAAVDAQNVGELPTGDNAVNEAIG